MSRPSTFSQQALRRVAERLGPESGLLDGLSRLPSTTSSVSLSTSHSISKVAKPASSVFMQRANVRQGKIFAAKPRSAPTSARKPGSAGLGDMAQKSASAHRHLAMSARASDDRDTAHKDAQKSARRTADGQSQQPQSCSHAEQQHAASPVNTEPAGSYAASPSLSPEAPEHSLLDRLQVQLTKLNDDIQSARADVSSVEHAPVRHHRPRGHLHSTVGVKSSSRVDVSTEAPEPKPEPARPTLDSVVKALQGQVAQLTAQVAAQLRDKESAATPKSARATEDLARQLAEKSVSVELLSQKLAAASVDSLKLREAADRLTSENEELRLAAKKYKRQMAEFRESWNALDKWADGLQAENDAKEAQVAKLTAELEELKGGQSRDKSALHTRLKQELALCDKLKAQIEELKAKGAEQEAQIKRLQSSASAHEELLQRKRAKDKQLDKVYSKREELERALDAAKKEQAAAAAAITQLESRLDVLRQRNTVLEKMAAAERDARAKADEENRVLDEECRLMASLISGVGNQSSILSSAAASLAASMPVAARQSARQTAEVPGAAAAAQELSPARELLYSPRARLNVAARIGAGHAVTNRLLESLRKDGAAVMDPQTIASIKQAPSPCELEMLRATTQPQQVRQPQQQEEEEDVAQLPLSGPEGIASAFRRFSGGGDSAATGGWSSSRGSRDELLPPAAAASVTAGAPIVLASPTPADWHRLQQQDPEEIECAGESQPPAVASNGGTCTASKAWSTGTASVSASISISARPTVPAVLNSSNIGRSIPEEEGSEVEQRQKGKTPQEVADGDAVSTSLAVQEATANNTPPPRAAAAVAVACNGAEAESTTAADAALSKTSQAVAPLRHQLFSGGRVSTDDLPLRPPVFVPDSSSMPKVAPALEERMRSISPQKQLPPPPAGLALGRRVEVRPAILNTGGPGAGAVPQLAKKQMEIFGVVPMDVAMSLGFDIEAARVAVPKAVSARATAAAAAEQQQQGESSVVLMATVASRPRTSSAGGAALDQQRQQQELVIPRHSPRTSPRQTASNTVPAPDNTQKQLVIPKHSPRTSPRQSTSNLPPSQQQEQQQLLSAVAATAAAAAATADPASNLVIPRHSPRQTASNTPRTSSSPRVSAGGKLPPPPEPLVQALSPRGGANPTAAAAPPPSQQQPASLSAAAANIGARAEAPQPLSASLAVPEAASSSSNNSMLPAAARLLSLESSQSLLSQANIKKLSLTEVLRLSGNGGGPA